MKKNIRTLINFLLIAGVLMIFATSCKKDNNTDDPTQIGTVKDVDGNVHTTVTIGTQVWMVENLNTTKYRDGNPIPNVTDNASWGNLKTEAYCNYNNDLSTGNKYGKLYNWYAVADSRNIAPIGWHVPTDAEWTTLINYMAGYLGASGNIGKALASKTDWASSTIGGAIGNDLTKNNTSSFTALPGGYRGYAGIAIGYGGVWWSSTEFNTYFAWYRELCCDYSVVYRNDVFKEYGFSVRCIKD